MRRAFGRAALQLTAKPVPAVWLAPGEPCWALLDLNLRPTDYESAALTAELQALPKLYYISSNRNISPDLERLRLCTTKRLVYKRRLIVPQFHG